MELNQMYGPTEDIFININSGTHSFSIFVRGLIGRAFDFVKVYVFSGFVTLEFCTFVNTFLCADVGVPLYSTTNI